MALYVVNGRGDLRLAFNSTTCRMHQVQVDGSGNVTDLGALQFNVGGGAIVGAPVSSGTTALATTTDAAVAAIAASTTQNYYRVMAINEGSVAGFISLDAGTTWLRLPALSSITMDNVSIVNKAIQIKRIAGGSDLSGVYVAAW